MAGKHPDGAKSPEALRARRLVEAMEFESSAEFARWVGVDPKRWHNFEAGYPFSRDMGRRLMNKIPGLSWAWLFDGNPNGLSVEMARRLGEFPDTPAKPPKLAADAKISLAPRQRARR